MLTKTFGCVRFIYNHMLADKIKYYKETKKNMHNTPAQYKKEFEWLKEVDSLALANAQMNLQAAYNKFFHSHKIGFPQFKSKKSECRSYKTNYVNGNIKIIDGYISLPKIGRVKLKQHRQISPDYRLKSVTVSQTSSGKYYASILFEYENQVPKIVPKTFLEISSSVQGLYKDSKGNQVEYPEYCQKSCEKLAKELRKLSKMHEASKNSNKQRIRIAKVYEKIANQCKDFLHKQSRQIVNAYDCVCIEKLNMKAMRKPLIFGKFSADNGFRMLGAYLKYKLESMGKQLISQTKMSTALN